MLDREKLRIVYIYLAYPDSKSAIDENYLKLDTAVYDETDTFNRFSMYNHSFDGGESWVEFSD